MDLFRYFHPHHNPRLRKVPPRLQELGELELAARELQRAIQRANIRNGESSNIEFDEALLSMESVIRTLNNLVHAHPGDSAETIGQLIEERKSIPGWENWARIVRERLEYTLIEKRAVG